MLQVGLIHAQSVYRNGLSILLEQGIDNLRVIASADNIGSLINQFREETLDIIIWDIPSHHVLTPGTRLLKDCFPLAKIIVLVASTNAVYAGLLQTLGANTVLSANCTIEELHQAILSIHESYTPHPSSNHVQEPTAAKTGVELNRNETAVLKLIAKDIPVHEIANKLQMSYSKMSKSLSVLKRKFRVKNLSELRKKTMELPFIKSNINQKET